MRNKLNNNNSNLSLRQSYYKTKLLKVFEILDL